MAETYGHLIPGADIAWVDRLNAETTLHQSAPGTHQVKEDSKNSGRKLLKVFGCPPGIRTPIC